jgi:A/G-specific adenine glycosylase
MDNLNKFTNALLLWYRQHQRNLPWRHTADPYKIWLSEVILQQTRVNQGLPYYEAFVNTYPTVTHLANAPTDEVLRLWQGLGYYSRARNLHFTAQMVCSSYGGVFPTDYKSLIKLKGIGTYTASAIASFASNEAVAVLDGNVFRVLARYFGEDTDILSSKGKNRFSELAISLLPVYNSSEYNQAIMEFGALQCIPAKPDCAVCPLQETCYAFSQGVQAHLPVKSPKKAVKTRFFTYIIIMINETIWMRQRVEKGIWQGLYEFYLIETEKEPEVVNTMKTFSRNYQGNETDLVWQEYQEIYTHKLTHQHLNIKILKLFIPTGDSLAKMPELKEGRFFSASEIEQLPKPIILDKVWAKLFFV